MAQTETAPMSERRALLTDREREIISGRADDVADDYRYQTVSRIRARLRELEGDIAAMDQHGQLGNDFRQAVGKIYYCPVCGDPFQSPMHAATHATGPNVHNLTVDEFNELVPDWWDFPRDGE